MKFNIIFPMAGESSRFDYEFKPFLQISDETFIELAYKYFKNYEDRINQLYFIITQEQENNLNVKNTLNDMDIIIPKVKNTLDDMKVIMPEIKDILRMVTKLCEFENFTSQYGFLCQ